MLRIQHPDSWTVWALDTACYTALGIVAVMVFCGLQSPAEGLKQGFTQQQAKAMSALAIQAQTRFNKDRGYKGHLKPIKGHRHHTSKKRLIKKGKNHG